MSLEAQIETLNTNIVALINVMSGAQVTTAAPAPSKPAKAPKPAPVAAPVATSPTQAAPVAQPAAAPTPPAAAPAATIEDARKLVIELGQKKGREAVMSLLQKFGASKLPEVPPHMYAAVVQGATEALAA